MKRAEKYDQLVTHLKEFPKVGIAFSGGVDSTFLLAAAREAHGENVVAFTMQASYIPKGEIDDAVKLAKQLNVKQVLVDSEIPANMLHNPNDRCYHCKRGIFQHMIEAAAREGITHLFDGSNADDRIEERQGLKILADLGIKSPMLELGITKSDIRAMSFKMDLPTWDKPSYSCLLTRIPFDQTISAKDLSRIEKAEKYMGDLGFDIVRVRLHGDVGRIEVEKHRRQELMGVELSKKIAKRFAELGFNFATVDITGYTAPVERGITHRHGV